LDEKLISADQQKTFLPRINADRRGSKEIAKIAEIAQDRRNWKSVTWSLKTADYVHQGGIHLRSVLISVIGVHQR
jgi:hypothetical protein